MPKPPMIEPFDLPDDDRPRKRRRDRDDEEEPPLSRAVYIVLGLLLGWLGVHNFYAGYAKFGAAQAAASVLGLFSWAIVKGASPDTKIGTMLVVIFALTSCTTMLFLPLSILHDIITTKKDARGRWMR
ncbi:MAG: NINE protein [Gemmataceae bacterium]